MLGIITASIASSGLGGLAAYLFLKYKQKTKIVVAPYHPQPRPVDVSAPVTPITVPPAVTASAKTIEKPVAKVSRRDLIYEAAHSPDVLARMDQIRVYRSRSGLIPPDSRAQTDQTGWRDSISQRGQR